MIIFYR